MKMSIVESETKKRHEHYHNQDYEDDQSELEEEGISSTLIQNNPISDSSKDRTNKNGDYDEIYKLQKKFERELLKEMFGIVGDDEEVLEGMRIKRKKEKNLRIKHQSIPIKTQKFEDNEINEEKNDEVDKIKNKKEEINQIRKIADDKFKENLFKNHALLSKISVSENKSQEEMSQEYSTLKKVIMINNMELFLFKQNFVLFEKISAKIFWDHRNNKGSGDPFEKKIEFCVIGTHIQIDLVEQMFNFITQTVVQVKKEIGIVEAQIQIPALFLKKLIGNNHQNL